MNTIKKIYLYSLRLTIVHQLILCALAFTNSIGDASAQVDSIAKKSNELSIGLNLAKEVSLSAIYSPRNNTLLGLSFCVKNIILSTNANYVNRDLFEKQNYVIGSRDNRKIPLSGFEIALFYVRHLYNNKIVHPMVGVTYRKSVVYGGWSNEKIISSYGYNIPVRRVINFNDKFHQISSVFGLYFSSKNKFGYAVSCPIGVNIQRNTNSHYGEQVNVGGSSSHKEFVKKGNQAGLSIGLNFNIFYNFK